MDRQPRRRPSRRSATALAKEARRRLGRRSDSPPGSSLARRRGTPVAPTDKTAPTSRPRARP